jgi:hypothetical protein
VHKCRIGRRSTLLPGKPPIRFGEARAKSRCLPTGGSWARLPASAVRRSLSHSPRAPARPASQSGRGCQVTTLLRVDASPRSFVLSASSCLVASSQALACATVTRLPSLGSPPVVPANRCTWQGRHPSAALGLGPQVQGLGVLSAATTRAMANELTSPWSREAGLSSFVTATVPRC